MAENPEMLLGRVTAYPDSYSPNKLQRLSRSHARRSLGLADDESLPFSGADLWTAYELSWLNRKGTPGIGIAEITVPCESPSIIESKSLKLYLNSLNEHNFGSREDLLATLMADLSELCGVAVSIELIDIDTYQEKGFVHFDGISLDQFEVQCRDSSPNPDLLKLSDTGELVDESLYSHLFKSNCPVTGQPDWASVFVSYSGNAIERHALLAYLVSYRHHQAFHEHCVERIFTDIKSRCQPSRLTVVARYTRRGGIDINPWRSSEAEAPCNYRLSRQ
jgi:7-cyano-7-deazaguanine reductase